MKNIGLFLLFLVCARQAAADENNVQLYGMVNSGMTYISNGAGGSSVRTDGCGPQGCNRWGCGAGKVWAMACPVCSCWKAASISRMASPARAA